MEERNFEQQCAIKFCVKLGETGIETFSKLKQAYGSMLCWDHKCSSGVRHFQRAVNPLKMNPTLEDLQLHKWITMWRKCEPLFGQTVDSHCETIASGLNLNHTTVHQILTQELAMRKLCAKIVPKNLTIKWKDNRKDVCLHLLEWIQSDRNFLKTMITGDETWIFEYDPETKKTK